MKRVKRDRHEKKERKMKRRRRKEKGLDCAGIFENIMPRGKTDIALINNACLRPLG